MIAPLDTRRDVQTDFCINKAGSFDYHQNCQQYKQSKTGSHGRPGSACYQAGGRPAAARRAQPQQKNAGRPDSETQQHL
jgi:hypothetical protein